MIKELNVIENNTLTNDSFLIKNPQIIKLEDVMINYEKTNDYIKSKFFYSFKNICLDLTIFLGTNAILMLLVLLLNLKSNINKLNSDF